MESEGTEKTYEGIQALLKDESAETCCAVLKLMVEAKQEEARNEIRIKLQAIQQTLASLLLKIKECETNNQLVSISIRGNYAVEFAKIEETRLNLEAQVRTEIAVATATTNATKATLEAELIVVQNTAFELEANLSNPSVCGIKLCR